MSPAAILTNLVSLAFILASFQATHADPRIIIYSFAFMACARFFTVELLMGLNRFGPEGLRKVLPYFCSPPHPGQSPNLLINGQTNKPTGDWGYYMFVLIPLAMVFAAMTFLDKNFTLETFQFQMKWGLIYLGLYWTQDLLSRAVIVDFKESRIANLSYNMYATLILFSAVFIGWFPMILFGKTHFLNIPWLFCALLLAIKHGSDFYLALLKGRRAPIPNLLSK